jgi:hypothetical protein
LEWIDATYLFEAEEAVEEVAGEVDAVVVDAEAVDVAVVVAEEDVLGVEAEDG